LCCLTHTFFWTPFFFPPFVDGQLPPFVVPRCPPASSVAMSSLSNDPLIFHPQLGVMTVVLQPLSHNYYFQGLPLLSFPSYGFFDRRSLRCFLFSHEAYSCSVFPDIAYPGEGNYIFAGWKGSSCSVGFPIAYRAFIRPICPGPWRWHSFRLELFLFWGK